MSAKYRRWRECRRQNVYDGPAVRVATLQSGEHWWWHVAGNMIDNMFDMHV